MPFFFILLSNSRVVVNYMQTMCAIRYVRVMLCAMTFRIVPRFFHLFITLFVHQNRFNFLEESGSYVRKKQMMDSISAIRGYIER